MSIESFANVDYLPRLPVPHTYSIGLIGCGGITVDHLTAYKDAGFPVIALCDIDLARAEQKRDEFFPDAFVTTDHRELLSMDAIDVVDIATHTAHRPPIIEAAIQASKHVLSQKPFVLDLDVGRQLVKLAKAHSVKLAVNQNGRWAPHFSFARSAIKSGLIGRLLSANLSVHWDHTWVKGTPFENMHDLVLFDYAIHWFDMISCLFEGQKAQRVYASACRTASQEIVPPLLANVIIEFDAGTANLSFNADTRLGSIDRTILVGDRATIESRGPNEKQQSVQVTTNEGCFCPSLKGCWFPDAFAGTMAELMWSIAEDREPSISAESNLHSLELCFAAVFSAAEGKPMTPGSVTSIPS